MVLDRAGLGPGQSAVDLGCGPRGVLDLLAARVGPDGRVVGVDADPAHVAMATEFAAGRGLGNVEVLTADARGTGLPSSSFDVVHARTLLVTVPEPAVVAAEMARLALLGGRGGVRGARRREHVLLPRQRRLRPDIRASSRPSSAATEPTR